ncbi:MAG TPA: hypothetical protein PK740_02855 [Bacteroidales bacterium]|jgi:L-asparagine transporter-like permease|nr:hypothetical protein [Bacteroidales bacterium]
MAKIKVPKYVYRIIIISIIVTVLSLIMQNVFPAYASPALPFIVLFFFFLTLFTLYIVLRDSSRRESKKFVSGYLLSRIVKFMSSLLFILIYILLTPNDKWQFAVAFIIIYFIYATCEVIIIKKENDKTSQK